MPSQPPGWFDESVPRRGHPHQHTYCAYLCHPRSIGMGAVANPSSARYSFLEHSRKQRLTTDRGSLSGLRPYLLPIAPVLSPTAACKDVDPVGLFFGTLYLTRSTIFPHGSSKNRHLYACPTQYGSILVQGWQPPHPGKIFHRPQRELTTTQATTGDIQRHPQPGKGTNPAYISGFAITGDTERHPRTSLTRRGSLVRLQHRPLRKSSILQ